MRHMVHSVSVLTDHFSLSENLHSTITSQKEHVQASLEPVPTGISMATPHIIIQAVQRPVISHGEALSKLGSQS